MTNAPIDRPALTKALFDHLAAEVPTVLFGRGVAPPSGGWPEGKERNGPWVPYCVIKTGEAITPAPGHPERLGRDRTTWQCTYFLTSHHTAESKADEQGQLVRNAAVLFHDALTLGGVDWVIQESAVTKLGASETDSSTDPDHWRVTDVVSVRLSRVSAR